MYNACLKLAYFPIKWKHATVVAIPKAGKDITNPSNYRPISLLNSLSKTFERIILARLNRHLELHSTMPHEQFGFKSGHSTVHQLVRISQRVKQGFANGQSTGMVLLDVEKAYDSVWQEAIVYKLQRAHCPQYLVKIIHSFLTDRTFQVSVQGYKSSTRPIPYGVPQGAVLSPILYNVFTADVLKVDGVVYAFFADDTAFFATDKDPQIILCKLQHAQNTLEAYQRRWRIKTNTTKSQAIFFTQKRAPRNLPNRSIVVNGHPVEWSNQANYLGMILDTKLKFDKHIINCTTKVDRATKALYSLVNRRS